ncbi:MAG TPA: hypothetical protein VI299_15695, partial [Polyangiales bacterium]
MALESLLGELAAIDRRCEVRSLRLRTLRVGPIDVASIANHVQGITRFDREGAAYFAVSVSGPKHGEIWLARFELKRGDASVGGAVIASLQTELAHPGGLQACGDLLAVACEGDSGWARVEVYDVSDPTQPRLRDTLVLDNSLREGVSQLTRSKAGWLGFGRLTESEYLLFVGGKRFGEKEGWFYRYRPQAAQRFDYAGPFAGKVVSTRSGAWGPQSGVAIVNAGAGAPALVTFGAEGGSGRASLKSEMRCFSIGLVEHGPTTLSQEPRQAPALYRFASADLSKLFGANARWGTTAFLDASGRLLTYFTARNP